MMDFEKWRDTLPSLKFDPISPQESTIQTSTYRLTILTTGLVRFESSQDGTFEDRASTFAVNRNLPTPVYKRIDGEGGGVEILTDYFHLDYDGGAFTPSGLSVTLNARLGKHMSRWRFGAQTTNLGGTARTLDKINGRCELERGIISEDGFAVVDDSDSMLFTEDGWVGSRKPGRKDYYLFAYGRDYKAALKGFYGVSGNQPLLPRWTLGNWWSRYYEYTAETYLGVVDRFKKEEIPLSVAVLDMDWHLVKNIPAGQGTGWTGYTWNKDYFPDPEKFLQDLHDRGLQVTLNTHPADGVRSFEDPYEAMCKALNRDPLTGHVIAFNCTDKQFMTAYFTILSHSLEKQGVDFWWLDWQQGTYTKTPGIDPLWMLNHYHFLDFGRDGKRCITFSRYAGPGSHRYPIGFSGDTHITWESLEFQPEFTATASNIGYGWWSHDIGGHFHGYKDNELTARWTQLGVFSPILRLHSSVNPYNTREPWRHSKETQTIMTSYLQLRHRLLPYIYTMAVRAASEGESIVTPIYYEHPNNHLSYQYRNQFYFGNQLMVSAVTSPRSKSTLMGVASTWFPPVQGKWVDIFSGLVYEGDRIINVHRRLEDYPVFAAQGAIIPLDSGELENGCPLPKSIEVIIVVGKDGSFELVEDDGMGAELDQVVFNKTLITFNQTEGVVKIAASSDSRDWSVRLISCTPSNLKATTGGKTIDIKTEKVTNGTLIHLGSSSTDIVLNLGANPALDPNAVYAIVYDLLDSFQIEIDVKGDILSIAERRSRGDSLAVTLSRLRAFELGPEVFEALEEVLLADSGVREEEYVSWDSTKRMVSDRIDG